MTEVVATLALQLDLRGFTPGAEKRLLTLEKALIGIERASRAAAPALNMFTLALKGTLAPAQQLTAALPAISSAFKGQSQFASRYATSLSRVATAAAAAAQNLNTIPRNLPFPPGQGGGGGAGGGSRGMELGGYVGLSPGGLFSGMMLRGAGAGIAGVAMAAQAGFSAISALAGVFSDLGANALQAGRDMDSAIAALTAVRGSSAVAREELQGVINTALKFAIPIEDTTKGYARLMAAAGDNPKLQQSAKDTFEALMLSARAMSLSGEQVGGIMTALEQILSKGKLQAEELRKQLGNRLPGAFRIAADSMGMTTAQLDKALKMGEISAEKFFTGFAKGLKDAFGGGVNVAMGNLAAMETQVKNLEKLLGAEISAKFLAPFEKAATLPMLNQLDQMLSTLKGSDVTEGTKALSALGTAWGNLKADSLKAATELVTAILGGGNNANASRNMMVFTSLIRAMGTYVSSGMKVTEANKKFWEEMARGQLAEMVRAQQEQDRLDEEAEQKRKARAQKVSDTQKEISEKALREIKRQETFVESLQKKIEGLTLTEAQRMVKEIERADLSPAMLKRAMALNQEYEIAVKAKEASEAWLRVQREQARESEKMLQNMAKMEEQMKALGKPPELSDLGTSPFLPSAMEGRLSSRFGRREDMDRDFLAMLLRGEKGRLTAQQAAEALEMLERKLNDSYDAVRSFQEAVVQDFGRSLVDAAFEGKEAWSEFGRSTLRMLADLVIQLNIVMPLMEAMKGGGGRGFSGWLSGLLSFGANAAPAKTIAATGGGTAVVPASGPISITINAAPGGGTTASVVAPGGETDLARNIEAAVLGVIDRQSRPGGRLWPGRAAR